MGTHPIFESDFDCLTDENMSMFAGQNGGPYSGSVTNPMMNPMMNNYSQNISAWMAPKQYGILATGVGSARDNILPGNVTTGRKETKNASSTGSKTESSFDYV